MEWLVLIGWMKAYTTRPPVRLNLINFSRPGYVYSQQELAENGIEKSGEIEKWWVKPEPSPFSAGPS